MIYARIQSDSVEEQEKDSNSPASNCHEIIPSQCSLNPDSLVNKSCAKKQIGGGERHPDAFNEVVRNICLFLLNKTPPYIHISEFTILCCNPRQLFASSQPNAKTVRLSEMKLKPAGAGRSWGPAVPGQGMSDAMVGRGWGPGPGRGGQQPRCPPQGLGPGEADPPT